LLTAHAGRAVNLFAPDYSSVSWADAADTLMEGHGCKQRGRDARMDATVRRLMPARSYSFGIEGVSARMRDLIAKPLSEDAILGAMADLSGRGLQVKLYFIVGLPGETPDDHYKQSLKVQRFGVPAREALSRLVAAPQPELKHLTLGLVRVPMRVALQWVLSEFAKELFSCRRTAGN